MAQLQTRIVATIFNVPMRGALALWLLLATSAALAAQTQSNITTKPPFTNRLIDTDAPYLLLRAHNPADWYPWGPEAFARAEAEDKPIFLSVGYSTCFCCHVAERTLYTDPKIAAVMNKLFINIKVDRAYMLARQIIAGSGGWPNNCFSPSICMHSMPAATFRHNVTNSAGPGSHK